MSAVPTSSILARTQSSPAPLANFLAVTAVLLIYRYNIRIDPIIFIYWSFHKMTSSSVDIHLQMCDEKKGLKSSVKTLILPEIRVVSNVSMTTEKADRVQLLSSKNTSKNFLIRSIWTFRVCELNCFASH